MSMSYNGSPIAIQAGDGAVFRPFGPQIYQGTFNNIDMLEELCEESRHNSEDVRNDLAGNLHEEWRLILKEFKHEPLLEELFNHVASWELTNRSLDERHRGDLIEQMDLINMWVNYQHTYDWNPPHNHGGDASFVIYIDNPVDFNKEDEYGNQKGNTPTSGIIQFRYGEQFIRSQQLWECIPARGNLLIFPSWLEHQVFPFMQPDIVRISVAGNINIGRNNNMEIS